MTRRAGTPLLLASVALAMGGAVANGFVYDDVPILVDNVRLHRLVDLPALLTHPWWPNGLWRPATSLGFSLQWAAGGGSPPLFHAVSLLLYGLVVLLLRRLLERLGVPAGIAIGAALLFAVHPVHVEVVANTVGQAELLCAIGLLGGAGHYLALRRAAAPRPRDAVLLLGWQLLAAGAKEQGFLLLPLLLILEWARPAVLPAIAPRRAMRMLLPAALAALTLFVLRAEVTGSFAGETPAAPLRGLAAPARAAVFLGAVPTIARLVVWPAHLQADYSPPAVPVDDGAMPARLLGALLLLSLAVPLFACRRRVPLVSVGLGWTALTLLPVASVFAPAGLLLAERVLFLPGIGLAVAGGAAFAEAAARRATTPRWVVPLVAALALLAAGRSAWRVPVWRSQDGFYAALPRDADDAYRAQVVAGNYRAERGDAVEAERLLRRAVALYDGDPFAWESLGQLLRAEGRCAEAIPYFARGLALEPHRAPLRARLVACHRRLGDDRTADRLAAEGAALDLLADPDAR